jgi:hypothetical protein
MYRKSIPHIKPRYARSTLCHTCQVLPSTYSAQQKAGSLSILMQVIQAPGNFLIAAYQALAPNSSVTTWLPYLLAGLLQLALVCCVASGV